MDNTPEIRAKVTSKVDVLIRATDSDVNLEEPFYAINWFSTKVEWLYHFYNFLASKSVRKIGGRAFFKAKVTETILDEGKSKRDLILIVRYPGGLNFKSLMESTYFKIVSIFRVYSVSKFTFGFTHKIVASPDSDDDVGHVYAIHHFKHGDNPQNVLQRIAQLISNDISIKYAGHIIATLNSQEKNKAVKQIPNLMDAIVIFRSSKESHLQDLFGSTDYKDLLSKLQSSHISLLKRIRV